MINCRALRTDNIKIFCLDEADELLSRGFKDQIYKVITNWPVDVVFQLFAQDTQVVLLSATMPADVLEVTKKFMYEPVGILVKILMSLRLARQVLTAFYQRTLSFVVYLTHGNPS